MMIRDSAPPATPAALGKLAEVLGGPVPPAFARLLAVSNGGRPEPSAFEAPGLGWSVVTQLFAAADGDGSIMAVASATDFFDLPPLTLPIGADPGGNLLLIGSDGAISLFAFCGWPVGASPAVVRLADDLDGFLAGLRPAAGIRNWASDYAAINAAAGHAEWGHDAPPDYHWHLDIPTGAMQLVPQDVHWMAPHVSSTSRVRR